MQKVAAGTGLAGVLLVFTLSHKASADVGNPAGKMQLFQQEQAARREHMLVRPAPQEPEAVRTLINMKPRPKTFTEANMKYLKGLLDKAAWMGGEQRIVHEMWTVREQANNGNHAMQTTSHN